MACDEKNFICGLCQKTLSFTNTWTFCLFGISLFKLVVVLSAISNYSIVVQSKLANVILAHFGCNTVGEQSAVSALKLTETVIHFYLFFFLGYWGQPLNLSLTRSTTLASKNDENIQQGVPVYKCLVALNYFYMNAHSQIFGLVKLNIGRS